MTHPRRIEGLDQRSRALLELATLLRAADYKFVTPTPATHRRVNLRDRQAGKRDACVLREVFGWSRAFDAQTLPQAMFALLCAAGELLRLPDEETNGEARYRSGVRFSSLGGRLYVHSAFPTTAADAVFFGPDTYRFARLLERWAEPVERAVDIGCGSGAGGLSLRPCAHLMLTDVNPRALDFARVNAALHDAPVEVVRSDVLRDVPGKFGLIIANPPYMMDPDGPAYRSGGGQFGEALSVRIVREALPRLGAGGTLILYTGAAIVAGVDSFFRAVLPTLGEHAVHVDYEELDPDVFGEELDLPAYADVERIAAVGLRVRTKA